MPILGEECNEAKKARCANFSLAPTRPSSFNRAMAKNTAPGKATKAATKSAVSQAPASEAAAKKTASPKTALREEERVEVGVLARHPALSDASLRAFAGQITEAAAETRGHETTAVGTLRDARAWVVTIERVILSGATVRYSLARLLYFLTAVDALARALDGISTASAGTALSLAESRARVARNSLLEALESLVLGNEEAEAELSEKRGSTERVELIVTSLRSLTEMAEGWLAKSDEESLALIESAQLNTDDVARAREAADALGASALAKTEAGAERARDSASVNRLEGRVTFEMAVVMRAFNAAAARGVGERLVPGPATRHLLMPSATKKKTSA